MNALPDTAAARLDAALAALDMAADVVHAPAMLRYLQELARWNKAYNLTSIRSIDDMLPQHLFDSLSILPALRELRQTASTRVLDIGSGAGLPGLIIGLCEPQWQVVCVDAVQKKTAFVQQAAGVLGLRNVAALHGRIEQLPVQEADVVVSRAFASLADFVRLGGRHCVPTGQVLAMKGRVPQDEIAALPAPWLCTRVRPLQVPELDAERCLLYLNSKDTDAQG